jgi:hypothetical protein
MYRDEGWYIVEKVLSEYFLGDNAENHAVL